MQNPAQTYAQAAESLNRGDWPRALALAESLLPQADDLAGVHVVAGLAALNLGRLPQALPRLARAAELDPARQDYQAHLARALLTARRGDAAIAACDRAALISPGDAASLDILGTVYTALSLQAKALAVLERAVALAPDHAGYRFNLAATHVSLGSLDAAAVHYEHCLRLKPDFWKAHLALAQLRRVTAEDNHVARMQALLETTKDEGEGAMSLNLALAKEREDLGETGPAFAHYVAGKAAGKRLLPPAAATDDAIFETLMRAFPVPEPLDAGAGHDSDEPIFVFGMPRSGTTLVERILSSHPDVHSAGELPNLGLVLRHLAGTPGPNVLDPQALAASRGLDWARLGRDYLASTRPGTAGKPHFVDKFPHNFLFAPHIARALPNARMVCLRRNPLDTCLGNLRQLFSLRSPFHRYSFDLMDIGRYYLLFDRMMAHWREVLPGRILEIDYEDLVEHQEASTRRLLAFCGLDWHDDCLAFERNTAPVATASAVQVRSPIFRSGLGRWRKYEAELAPLRELLAPVLPPGA
jgi:tetratricopeptide (TPR) repeat protein